jgi:hypothetical protein
MATFADYTAVMTVGEIVESSARKLQSAVNTVVIWRKKYEQTSTYPSRYVLTVQTKRLYKI